MLLAGLHCQYRRILASTDVIAVVVAYPGTCPFDLFWTILRGCQSGTTTRSAEHEISEERLQSSNNKSIKYINKAETAKRKEK